jgi:thiol:disulfide interchange protein DsbC
MKKYFLLCLTLFTLNVLMNTAKAVTTATAKQLNDLNEVIQTLKQKYPSTQFSEIKPTPVGGIYQVVMGKNVAYVDTSGQYFFFGHLFDMQNQIDLTEGVLEQVSQVDWNKLPLSKALLFGQADAVKKIVVFSDPNCVYCKRFETEIKKLNEQGVAVYTFMFPVLGQDSREKSISVWCSKNPQQTWNDWMTKGREPSFTNCPNPIDEVFRLGQSLGLSGTPSVILPNGSVITGYKTANDILSFLDQIKKNQAQATTKQK